MVIIPVVAFRWLPLFMLAGDETAGDVVSRKPSPDGRYEAIVVETNGGATTDFGYEVYIEPARSTRQSHQVALLYGAVRNAEAYGVNVRWLNPRSLSIEYLTAKWTRDVVDHPVVDRENFSLGLRSGVTDSSAPAGGMLYNLER